MGTSNVHLDSAFETASTVSSKINDNTLDYGDWAIMEPGKFYFISMVGLKLFAGGSFQIFFQENPKSWKFLENFNFLVFEKKVFDFFWVHFLVL